MALAKFTLLQSLGLVSPALAGILAATFTQSPAARCLVFRPDRHARGIALITIAAVCALLVIQPVAARPYPKANPAWTPYSPDDLKQMELKSSKGDDYRIILSVPREAPPHGGYPVIYVVDGNAWTALVAGIIGTNLEFGLKSKTVPAVVVGIGYPTDNPWDIHRRTHDLTPPTRFGADVTAVTGGAANRQLAGGDIDLMDFIDRSVKPLVESSAPINLRRQVLVGHSLGGLFTIDTLLNRPASYQTYIALSPSLWWDHEMIFSRVSRFLGKNGRRPRFRIFMSSGSAEQYWTPAYRRLVEQALTNRSPNVFTKLASNAPGPTEVATEMQKMHQEALKRFEMVELPKRLEQEFRAHGLDSTYVVFPGEDHFSVVPAALGTAVPWALQDGDGQ